MQAQSVFLQKDLVDRKEMFEHIVTLLIGQVLYHTKHEATFLQFDE